MSWMHSLRPQRGDQHQQRSDSHRGGTGLPGGGGFALGNPTKGQTVYLSVPILDANGTIVDLRIADVDQEHRSDSNAYHEAVGQLGSTIFTDPGNVIDAARSAWARGTTDPFTTRRQYDDGIGKVLVDCEVTTMRLGDRIVQLCQDISPEHVVNPSDTLLRSVIDSADLGVMLYRPLFAGDTIDDLEVVWHNDAARSLWGIEMMEVGTRYSACTDDPTLVELAEEAWSNGSVNRLRRLPRLGRGDETTYSQSLQRVGDHLLEVVIDLTEQAQATKALRNLETRFGRTLDAVTDAILVVTPIRDDGGEVVDARVTYANEAVRRWFGIPAGQPLDDTSTFSRYGFTDRESTLDPIARAATGRRVEKLFGESTDLRHRVLRHLALAHASFAAMGDEVLIVIRDLSQLHHARGQLEHAIALDEMVLDALSEPAAILQLDSDGEPTIIACNDAGLIWLPHPPPVALGELPFPQALTEVRPGVLDAIERSIPSRSTFIADGDTVLPDEDVMAVRVVNSPMAGFRSLMVLHDISSEVNESRRYRRQSMRDVETGLLNSIGFQEEFTTGLAARTVGAVVTLKLDQFERIETMLGASITNSILRSIVDRITSVTPDGAIAGRLRFMTFVFALPVELDAEAVKTFADRLIANLDQPFVVDGRSVHIGGHAGIAFLSGSDPDDGRVTTPPSDADHVAEIAQQVVQRARASATRAQQLHVASLEWDERLALDEPRRIELLGQLERAMTERELFLVYQPQLSPDGRLLGAEALIRWNHPEHGLLPPGEFIEAVETSTLVLPFTAYALREAVTEYHRSGLPGKCSVNVPPALLADPGFIPTVCRVLDETGAPPSVLCIEVTERGLMRVVDFVTGATARLHELGVSVAMDDFGTGSTSLAHIGALGFDTVKIDRSIVQHIDSDPVKQAIMSGISTIADAVGFELVAEGVETEAERNEVVRLGCDGLQGFLLVRPAPLADWADRYR